MYINKRHWLKPAAIIICVLAFMMIGLAEGSDPQSSKAENGAPAVETDLSEAVPDEAAETGKPAESQQEEPKVQPEISDAAQEQPETAQEETDSRQEQSVSAGRLAGLKIGIDPGHQLHANNGKELVKPGGTEKKPKVSSGTSGVSTRVPEYVVNLDVALMLRDALEAEGAEVKLTREEHDVDISNIERAQMMNEWGADLVLRIHCNGVSSRKKQGIGLYVRKTGTRHEECLAAAEAILPRMVEKTGAVRDGIFRRDTYSGLNWSEVPSILVEMGYMSNPTEDQRLNDPDYQMLLVDGMVEGIADYFGRTDETITDSSVGE